MIPKAEHNLIWQLFSAQAEKVQEAARHYAESGSEINTMINDLLAKYQAEGINMPYTLEDYRKDTVRSGLNLLTPQERLSGLAPEEVLTHYKPEVVLTHYKPEEVLTHYKPEVRLAGLAPEVVLTHYKPEVRLAGLTPEELLAGLSVKDREGLIKRLLSEQKPAALDED